MRGVSPRGNAPAESSGQFDSVPTVAVLLLMGLALRFIIAYVLLPGSGFPNDLASFRGWSGQLVDNTPLGFYDGQGLIDYPPVYLLLLWIQGLFFSPFGGLGEGVKLIPIFTDLALATAVYFMARDLGASDKRALFAMVVVLLNPVTWFNSAVWGQVDSVGSFFMLLGLWALVHDRRELASALAVVAALTKIQLAVLGLLVGLIVLRRSLLPREGEAAPARVLTSIAAGAIAAALICLPFSGLHMQVLVDHLRAVVDTLTLQFHGLGATEFLTQQTTASGLLTLAVGLLAAPGVFVAVRRIDRLGDGATRMATALTAAVGVVLAFGLMTFDSIVGHVASSFGEYPYLTLNAYNPWALVGGTLPGGQQADSMSQNIYSWVHDAPGTGDNGIPYEGLTFGPFSGDVSIGPLHLGVVQALVGVVVVLIAVAVVAWLAARTRAIDPPPGSLDLEPAATPAPQAPQSPAAAVSAAPAASASPIRRWVDGLRLWLPDELRAIAAVCLVGAGVAALLLAAQPLNGMPAAVFGDALLLTTVLGVCLWAAWRDDRLSIVVALAILAISFFVLPTRVHERYLFPFFAVGALLLAVSWRWTVTYVVLSILNFGNLLAVIVLYTNVQDNTGLPLKDGGFAHQLYDWGTFFFSARIPAEFSSPITPAGAIWPIALSAVVTGLALIWGLLQMRRRGVASLAAEADRAGEAFAQSPAESPAGRATEHEPAGAVAPVSSEAVPVVRFASDLPETDPMPPDWTQPGTVDEAEGLEDYGDYDWAEEDLPYSDDEPEYVPGWVMAVWHRLFLRSRMPDRSPSLSGEPRGRLDKLDLWLVAALIITILTFRIWRLDEPRQMYFDEVYHARTGAEFLQDWRYNIPHDIFEWTHPHFAKYVIAGGLTVFSDDKVTSTGGLGVPVKDAVVQPRSIPPDSADQTPDQTPDQTAEQASAAAARADPNARLGDRVLIATGEEVRSYDLQTRTLEAQFKVPGASSLSLDSAGNLYVGTSDGHVWRINTNSLDDVRLGTAKKPIAPVELPVDTGFAVAHMYAGSAPAILAVDATGNIVSMDGTGKVLARGFVDGAVAFAPMGAGPAAIVELPSTTESPTESPSESPSESPTEQPSGEPTSGTDMAAEVQALADAVGLDPLAVEAQIPAPDPSSEQIIDLGSLTDQQLAAVQQLVDDGKLPDFDVRRGDPQIAVAFSGGLGVLDAQFATLTMTAGDWTYGPATSIAINPDTSQDSYVTAGDSLVLVHVDQTGAGVVSVNGDQPLRKMPGQVTKVIYDGATKVAQVLGRTPDGSGWTVYAIETNGNTVFMDATLPWEPVALTADSTPDLPQTDREALLAFAPDGSMASVDIGQFAFGWRIMGVLFGTLMAVCLYLLARLLFKRRSVGVLIALFSCIDGMMFAQSRIAMNDTYVGGLMLLGYLIFTLLWLQDRTSRKAWLAFWLGMPVLGVVMGLALFSKWVALYALASMGILILIRSALGRLIAILGLAAGTGTLGWAAIREMHTLPDTGNMPVWGLLMATALGAIGLGIYLARKRARTSPDRVLFAALGVIAAIPIALVAMTFYPQSDQNGSPNYTFFLLMLAATAIAAAANAYHPVAWTRHEFWFSVIAPGVVAVLVAIVLAGFKHAGFLTMEWTRIVELAGAGIAAGPAFGAAFWVAGRWGFGPLASAAVAAGSLQLRRAALPRPQGLAEVRFGLRPAGPLGGAVPADPAVLRVHRHVHPLDDALAAPDGRQQQPAGPLLRPQRIRPLLRRRLPERRRLAGRPHGPDAHGPDAGHVRLPQRPAGGPRRQLAVVGLADGPQAGVVREHHLRPGHGLDDLRRRHAAAVVAGDRGDVLRRLAGVQTPEPGPDPHRGGVPVAVAVVGAHRQGRLPIPLLYGLAVLPDGPGLLPGRTVARPVPPDVAAGQARAGRGHRLRACAVAGQVPALQPGSRVYGRLLGQDHLRQHFRSVRGRHPHLPDRGRPANGAGLAGDRFVPPRTQPAGKRRGAELGLDRAARGPGGRGRGAVAVDRPERALESADRHPDAVGHCRHPAPDRADRGCGGRAGDAQPAALRAGGLRRGRDHVRGPVPQSVRPADARLDHFRLQRLPPDLVLRVPVLGQPAGFRARPIRQLRDAGHVRSGRLRGPGRILPGLDQARRERVSAAPAGDRGRGVEFDRRFRHAGRRFGAGRFGREFELGNPGPAGRPVRPGVAAPGSRPGRAAGPAGPRPSSPAAAGPGRPGDGSRSCNTPRPSR